MSKKSLEFHIESNDYFGTLATVFDLLRQNLNPFNQKREKKTLENAVADLVYLCRSITGSRRNINNLIK